ncbi:MFS transporter [Rhizobium sp. LEGMi198b]|uniref:MFS transporter n=1 Tax=unclassified Rhizobium TaxID=2613769 RepID=UPI000CDF5298|nr:MULTISPECIES: MFS transporter [Rhizobium]AVA19852.1 major facilitator superfamily protein [Rhizobium sp. NXC24]UWU21171.1 MFS transporter [Rhizobium tropici]WFU01975.1 MFS transporter [Rhizobium sp. CB3171]
MASATHESLNPTSSGLERDARNMHARATVDPGNIAIGVIIGRTSEFFDFFVYAIASVLVFPKLIFPFADPLQGTLLSFLVFSLAFIARPIGSFIFMAIDRTYGRGVKLTVALFLLGGSTASMSFLPGYSEVGVYAIILLAALRIGQGLALGGAWDGLASLLALNAPADRRGWYAMIPQLGAPTGFMLASALFAYFVTSLSTFDFLEYGWRYPFFCAFMVNVVALFARLRLVATPEFGALLERHELEPVKMTELLRVHGRDVLIGAFVPLASFATFHLVTVFPLGWVTLYSAQSPGSFLLVEFLGAICGIAAIVCSGLLADRIGRRNQLALGAVLIAAFAFVAPWLLDGGVTGRHIYVVVGFTLLGLSFGQAAGASASRFSRNYRYSGSALTSDLSWLIGAGFAPFVALALSSQFGLVYTSLYLLSGVVCTLVAIFFSKTLETRDN